MKPASDGRLADDLRDLVEALANAGHEPSSGVLGGEYGYGANYENDVFEMHPFWWGGCECGHEGREWDWEESHDHAGTCYQSVIRDRGFIDYDDPRHDTMSWADLNAHNLAVTDAVCAEMRLDPKYGTWVHCTCDREPARLAWLADNTHDPKCGVARPNFVHKASGFRVDWYKYIGRGMEHEPIDKSEWGRIQAECLESITPGTWVAPPPMTPEEEESAYQAFKDSVYVFDGTLGEVMQQIDETMRPVAVIESLEQDKH